VYLHNTRTMQRALLWHTYTANYVQNDVNLFGESPSTHRSSRMRLKKKMFAY